MQQQGGVAAIVENHVGVHRFIGGCRGGPFKDAMGEIPVFAERLALVRKHRCAARRNRRCGMILGRENVARSPAHLGTERLQGLDQHRGLDRHVQGTGDARAAQGLEWRVFFANGHQAGHLGLGDRELFTAPIGEFHVRDLKIAAGGGENSGRSNCSSHGVSNSLSSMLR